MAEGEYWFTVEVRNSGGQLIGLQSGPVQVSSDCTKLSYLPFIHKSEEGGSSPTCNPGDVLVFDDFDDGNPFS
ncbi:MAG: hypothetical protein SVT56_13755, partial [Chloroflexota bacterium]|nr:hypothetical protein [Chloroflexota bacterium]